MKSVMPLLHITLLGLYSNLTSAGLASLIIYILYNAYNTFILCNIYIT